MHAQMRGYAIYGAVILVVVGSFAGISGGATAESSATPASNTTTRVGELTTQPIVADESENARSRSTPTENFTLPSPDHGVNATVFPRLWSSDVDEVGASLERGLLSVRDYTFRKPPKAVETWNAGDHRDFPSTGRNSSIYPPNADLSDEIWIRDAYIQVFAVQPGTVAHISPDDKRHYIRSSGIVLATTDYRIDLPPDQHHDYNPRAPDPGETVLIEKTVAWRLLNHEMSKITLQADGDQVAAVGPTNTPRLAFNAIPRSTERLTLRVSISASFEKTVRRTYRTATQECDTRTIEEGNETRPVTDCDIKYDIFRTTDTDRLSREVTVRDSVDVAVYKLSPTASRTAFADGSSALAVNQSAGDPWAMYRLPDGGTVHNIWHFYSFRNPHWDTLVVSSDSGTTRQPSDAIPLQVHAFPSGGGAYARSEFGMLEVTQVWGPERQAPVLPGHLTVPATDQPYSLGSTVAVRVDEQVDLDGRITVHGLVRGTQSQITARTIRRQQATTLDLELLEINRSVGTATVRVSLQETCTGQPIDLRSRPGVIVVHGVEVETNASGTAVATVPLAGRMVTARFETGPWWAVDPVYQSSRASDSPPTEWPDPRQLVTAAFTIVLWLSPLLFGIFLIDRLLGKGRLWPPWRGIE